MADTTVGKREYKAPLSKLKLDLLTKYVPLLVGFPFSLICINILPLAVSNEFT